MKIRRWSVGLLAATLFVPGLAACKADSAEPGAAAPAIPADAKEALLASTKELSDGNFSFGITGGGFDGTGKVHKPSNSASVSVKTGDGDAEMSMAMDMIYIADDSWVKIQLSGSMVEGMPGMEKLNSGKYQHLDRARIKGNKDLEFDWDEVDMAGSEALTRAITKVEKTGEGAYAGTLDASKVSDSGALDADTVKALGDKGKALPFTAKLDAQGRLTEFVIQMPAVAGTDAGNLTITYGDFGAATPAQKPSADKVVEASDELYEMFK